MPSSFSDSASITPRRTLCQLVSVRLEVMGSLPLTFQLLKSLMWLSFPHRGQGVQLTRKFEKPHAFYKGKSILSSVMGGGCRRVKTVPRCRK